MLKSTHQLQSLIKKCKIRLILWYNFGSLLYIIDLKMMSDLIIHRTCEAIVTRGSLTVFFFMHVYLLPIHWWKVPKLIHLCQILALQCLMQAVNAWCSNNCLNWPWGNSCCYLNTSFIKWKPQVICRARTINIDLLWLQICILRPL